MLQSLADSLMVLLLHVEQVDRVLARSCRLAPGTNEHEQEDDARKSGIGHENRLLFLAVAFVIPPLPIFPRCVHTGVAGCGPPCPVHFAELALHVTLTAPASSIYIVETAFCGIAEDIVRGNDEAVALELRQVRDTIVLGMVLSIGVVELDKLVESEFVVDGALGYVKDIVRGGLFVQWPRKRRRVACISPSIWPTSRIVFRGRVEPAVWTGQSFPLCCYRRDRAYWQVSPLNECAP